MHNLDYANVVVSPAVDFKASRMELELSLIPEGRGRGGRSEGRGEAEEGGGKGRGGGREGERKSGYVGLPTSASRPPAFPVMVHTLRVPTLSSRLLSFCLWTHLPPLLSPTVTTSSPSSCRFRAPVVVVVSDSVYLIALKVFWDLQNALHALAALGLELRTLCSSVQSSTDHCPRLLEPSTHLRLHFSQPVGTYYLHPETYRPKHPSRTTITRHIQLMP